MKQYVVGVNQAAGEVKLVAYESKDIATNQNRHGLRDIQILGNHFMGPMFESTRKDDCYKFIKENYPTCEGWTLVDQSDYKITSSNSNENKRMPFTRKNDGQTNLAYHWIIGAMIEVMNELGYCYRLQIKEDGSLILLKRYMNGQEELVNHQFKTVDDIWHYIISEARRMVDLAKTYKQLKIGQKYLRSVLFGLQQYETGYRLCG